VQQSLDPQQEFGRFVYFDSEVYDKNICHNLLDTWPNQPMEELVLDGLTKTRGRWVTSDELKDITKKAFRDITPSSNAETNRLLDFGIDALREVQKLIIWRRQTTVKHNNESGVDVTCTTMLSPINNESNSSTFFYRITFENRGDDSIQLLGRHLKFSGEGIPPTIVGKWAPGVVGEKPILSPGEGFSYCSCCSLEGADRGEMEGAFRFSDASSGQPFEVLLEKTPLKS
jgi:uncharacterized protein affecting Mg2+/Co2+ transport